MNLVEKNAHTVRERYANCQICGYINSVVCIVYIQNIFIMTTVHFLYFDQHCCNTTKSFLYHTLVQLTLLYK